MSHVLIGGASGEAPREHVQPNPSKEATMMLTEHFSLAEMTDSSTANILQIDNRPNEAQIDALKALCENVLEPLRAKLGKPIIVTSGFRCERLNAAVGGVKNSAHTRGCAADVHVDGMTPLEVGVQVELLGIAYDQMIDEHVGKARWLHISYEPPQRRQALTIERP